MDHESVKQLIHVRSDQDKYVNEHGVLRGVYFTQVKDYRPNSKNLFKCRNTEQYVPFENINDDFCDCDDGTDEPSTSACPMGTFYCDTQFPKSSINSIPSGKLNDGICDCCDGSDEWLLVNNHKLQTAIMTVDEGIDITKAGDRGVLKRIIKEGEGTDTPGAGCQVTVHYTGTLLDGSKFDSSKDRNEPFEFNLGKGTVIKAWDIGVATMKKGEVCVLTCAPEYAYGAQGSPPKIPPNSTLQFEIEMINWKAEDLSPAKNKGILRHIIEQGSGSDYPNDGSQVTVELEGKYGDKVFDTRTVTFTLGEGTEHNVCEGIERALEKFLKDEKSRLIIQPKYAFKSEGNKELGVPPNTPVEYLVKLLSFEKAKESWSMDGDEKLEQAKLVKEKGTDYFKGNKYLLAIKKYKKVVSLVEDMPEDTSESEENKSQAKELLISAHLNLALVHLKASPPHHYEAKDHATKALKLDEKNVKGLFRRGQALLGIGEAERAMEDFRAIVEMEPENKAAAKQVLLCRNTLQKQKQREKQMYANMFDKFAKHDTQVEKERAEAEVDVIGEKVGEWGKGEGEWTDEQRDRKPTDFEKENPNILLLDKDGQFENM
ncbi:unnamed protein product [Pieris brassicae]|uniref:peptidylprolyl isomerase n=1 Tax=Pieris brassicae TaxID=7116 RepID=A0A9P0ST27_PIEBR|nr:unnamed protein product [Pieris brassicae]